MSTIKVPTTADGFRELLENPQNITQYFSREAAANGDTKEFLDSYAQVFAKKNTDAVDDLRTQVQAIMGDLVRENGGGKTPVVALRDGKPTVGTAAVSHGRGTVYNRAAPGHLLSEALKDEEKFSSVGEYCQAIRVDKVGATNSAQQKMVAKLNAVRRFQDSFGSEDPGAGGFLIPEAMRSELLQLALEESLVRSHATVIPMSTLRVPIPMVDETSHATSLFGGIQFYWTEESATLTESQATFGKVVLDAKKLTGFFKVPNELLADAPAFSAFFDSRIPAALAWFEDLAFMTETGAGTPQGFIGSPAYVTVDRATTNAIAYADIVAMYAQMLPTSLKNAIWIASIDSFPQLAKMSLSTPGVWMGGYNVPGVADAPPVTIFGRPVYFTEKVPATAASGGASGDISFVDLSYYLIGDRQSVAVAASTDYAFANDQTAYRLIERVDGRPWLQSAITPHNGSANLSAFVGLSATHT